MRKRSFSHISSSLLPSKTGITLYWFFSYIYFQNLWMGNLHEMFAYSVSNTVKEIQPKSCRKNKLTETLWYWGLVYVHNKAKKNTSVVNRNSLKYYS